MRESNCGNCGFFSEFKHDDGDGWCCRYPWTHPKSKTQWCGEHQPLVRVAHPDPADTPPPLHFVDTAPVNAAGLSVFFFIILPAIAAIALLIIWAHGW